GIAWTELESRLESVSAVRYSVDELEAAAGVEDPDTAGIAWTGAGELLRLESRFGAAGVWRGPNWKLRLGRGGVDRTGNCGWVESQDVDASLLEAGAALHDLVKVLGGTRARGAGFREWWTVRGELDRDEDGRGDLPKRSSKQFAVEALLLIGERRLLLALATACCAPHVRCNPRAAAPLLSAVHDFLFLLLSTTCAKLLFLPLS
ncbi:hypothetical protein CYMTET_34974, partial [Cymbomonas tetramitiformis]